MFGHIDRFLWTIHAECKFTIAFVEMCNFTTHNHKGYNKILHFDLSYIFPFIFLFYYGEDSLRGNNRPTLKTVRVKGVNVVKCHIVCAWRFDLRTGRLPRKIKRKRKRQRKIRKDKCRRACFIRIFNFFTTLTSTLFFPPELCRIVLPQTPRSEIQETKKNRKV